MLTYLCPRALPAASISPAALYRAVEQYQPTLLVDEAQWLTRRMSESAEALRELLCAGAERTATVLRIGGPDRDTLQRFRVYSPKVLAHIGDPDDVLADRSIVIRMERRQPTDRVEPWRSRTVEGEGRDLASQLCRWTRDHEDGLPDIYESTQAWDLGNDRAGDMWLPLKSVVSAADPGRLPELEQGARALTPADTDREATGIQLLAALREVFAGVEFLPTETILERLHARTDDPWASWSNGKPMTAHALAGQLRRFKVKSEVSADRSCRGYYLAPLKPLWSRYLPDSVPKQAPKAPEAPGADFPAVSQASFPGVFPGTGASGASGASYGRQPGEEG